MLMHRIDIAQPPVRLESRRFRRHSLPDQIAGPHFQMKSDFLFDFSPERGLPESP